tara:strand:+ start:1507 stop:1665 length:159 start_codon:yes stop_codon:yes gene_type:complete
MTAAKLKIRGIKKPGKAVISDKIASTEIRRDSNAPLGEYLDRSQRETGPRSV